MSEQTVGECLNIRSDPCLHTVPFCSLICNWPTYLKWIFLFFFGYQT